MSTVDRAASSAARLHFDPSLTHAESKGEAMAQLVLDSTASTRSTRSAIRYAEEELARASEERELAEMKDRATHTLMQGIVSGSLGIVSGLCGVGSGAAMAPGTANSGVTPLAAALRGGSDGLQASGTGAAKIFESLTARDETYMKEAQIMSGRLNRSASREEEALRELSGLERKALDFVQSLQQIEDQSLQALIYRV